MARLAWLTSRGSDPPEPARPELSLSGPLLDGAFQSMVKVSEEHGGIERYVEALKLKAALFRDTLGAGKVDALDLHSFVALCALMPTVRRRISPYLGTESFSNLRTGLAQLLSDITSPATADQRITDFCKCFPQDSAHRFVRDLAAEVLHYVDPERHPLTSRWVWDAKTNTGAVREIWWGDNVDGMTIPLADSYATFVMLREELVQFLARQGVFRDVVFYVDILIAHVYANYVAAQGGTYLRADFSTPEDPMHHTRRILGLDGFQLDSNRTKVKAENGQPFVLEDMKMLC